MRLSLSILALLVSATLTATADAYTDRQVSTAAVHHRVIPASHTFPYVVEHRRAIRHLRHEINDQRSRLRMGNHHWRPLSWNGVKLHRGLLWHRRVYRVMAHTPTPPPPVPTTAVGAICYFWHPCGFAIAVARCESGLSTGATNGQFLGLFQMGEYARSKYGHSSTFFGQAQAAYHYYQDAGWGPWECAHLV